MSNTDRIRNKIILVLAVFSALPGFAQNLQNYTPSILFGQGDWEFKSFQNLYHQTKNFAGNGGLEKQRGSEEWYFFTSIDQFLYGLNSQVNVGVDVWVNATALTRQENTESQTGVSLIGPKIKIAPFKSLHRLSIQSSYLFAATENMENRMPDGNHGLFFANDRSLWLTQFFYDLPLSAQWQLFFQQAFWYNVVRDSFRENNFLQTQTSVFASYFPNSRWTFYGMTEYFPTHYNANTGVQSGEAFFTYFVQSGAGAKYQLIPNKIELEFLYTNFWLGSGGEGAGQTFNLGIRLVNQ